MTAVIAEYWPILAIVMLLGFVTAWWIWGREGQRVRLDRHLDPEARAQPTLLRTAAPVTRSEPVMSPNAVPRSTSPGGGELLVLKGGGPRLAAALAVRGVSRVSDVAALSDDELGRLDAQMGALQGRLIRDRVVEQAKLLEAGDLATFEERFGKLEDSTL